MSKRIKPEFVTSLLACAFALTFADHAHAALFKVSLMEKSKVLSTRTIDTENPAKSGALPHAANGLSVEIQDKLASCDVFIEKAEVRVSLIENTKVPASGKMPSPNVVSNSALLSKQKIAPQDQTVFAGAAGAREVTVDAPKLNRTCTVSVL